MGKNKKDEHKKAADAQKKLLKDLLKYREYKVTHEATPKAATSNLPISSTALMKMPLDEKKIMPFVPTLTTNATAIETSTPEVIPENVSNTTTLPKTISEPSYLSNTFYAAVDGAALTFASCVTEDVMLANDCSESTIEITNTFMQAFLMFCRGGAMASMADFAASYAFRRLGFTEQSSALAGTLAGFATNAISHCDSTSSLLCFSTTLVGSYLGSRATLFTYNHFFRPEKNIFRNEGDNERLATAHHP